MRLDSGLDLADSAKSGAMPAHPKGAVWQYTAIDVASSLAWAELHATAKNPAAAYCRSLVERVASELARAGWRLGRPFDLRSRSAAS